METGHGLCGGGTKSGREMNGLTERPLSEHAEQFQSHG
jgi:hypothetical protein